MKSPDGRLGGEIERLSVLQTTADAIIWWKFPYVILVFRWHCGATIKQLIILVVGVDLSSTRAFSVLEALLNMFLGIKPRLYSKAPS
jgi:hypothetical protein